MNTCLFISRLVSLPILLFTLVVIFSADVWAQTPPPTDEPGPKTTSQSKKEKKFLLNILDDQRAIWTAPFHLGRSDKKWLAPLGLSTLTLMATDRLTTRELVEHGDNLKRLRISKNVSRVGSLYATGGLAGVLYLTGRATGNDRLRETGLLGAEALINSEIVVHGLKAASQRQRIPTDDSSGEFFDGGNSFPSGHAINVWSLATVVAKEYGHRRRLVQVGVYGVATAVSLSRFTGRNHFLSDVLVGSALGYGIGNYVYQKRHDPALDGKNEKQGNKLLQSKWFPRVVPLYSQRAHVYGGMLSWSF
jgi:membrane-associated phospholipid phosphatase